MHPVVLDEPYEFVPPYRGRCWPWLLQKYVGRLLHRSHGVEQLECEGIERLKESIAAGHSVLLAPNHCRPVDPLVITEMCRRAGLAPFTMASWHLFSQSRVQRFILRRIGAFSVYREGLDRQALQAGVEILQQPQRPLIIFPEGVITRTNDRILGLMDGVSFIARSAAKKRAAADPAGQVVVHPVAIRYHFHGDIDAALHETLESIEQRLSWLPIRDPDRVQRIYRVGEALLCLKEIEYFGRPKKGEFPGRLQRLIDRILVPLEQEWRNGKSERNVVARVKQLRTAILPDMIGDDLPEQEKERRWRQLADIYIAQQLFHYPSDYARSQPTPERLLETVERFEEDLTDDCRIHRPMSATVQIGTAIAVSPKRVRGTVEDPLMAELERQLHEMLEIPCPQIAPIKTDSEAPSVTISAQVEDSAVEIGSLGE
jgi:1-acyl-sn-glycerol-3-phosphate acyltransferase